MSFHDVRRADRHSGGHAVVRIQVQYLTPMAQEYCDLWLLRLAPGRSGPRLRGMRVLARKALLNYQLTSVGRPQRSSAVAVAGTSASLSVSV